jgi:hypothetical protein
MYSINTLVKFSGSDYQALSSFAGSSGAGSLCNQFFLPSDLAFHPITGNLYVLTQAKSVLYEFTPSLLCLGPAIAAVGGSASSKPQSIVFSADGTLAFISTFAPSGVWRYNATNGVFSNPVQIVNWGPSGPDAGRLPVGVRCVNRACLSAGVCVRVCG